MSGFKLAHSTLSTRSAALAAMSLLFLACGAPAQLDLGYDENALQAPDENATPVVVDPDTLQATIVEISSEGVLCPPGSVGIAIASSGTTATVILSEATGGVQTAGCVLTFQIDVPEGLALSMPTTILRGVSLGRTNLERNYSFEGAINGPYGFIEVPAEDFVLVDHSGLIESPSCGVNRRVSYEVDITAQLLYTETFFQLDAVDVDTTFRRGTDWRFCDLGLELVVAPGESGDFCDGLNERPCAQGLVCDRERDPNSDEGVCSEP
jgi:hypothetical protein